MCFVLHFHIAEHVEAHVPIGWGMEWYLQGTAGELTVTGRALSGKFAPLLFTGLGVGCEWNKAPAAILQPSLQPLMG